MGQSQRKVLLVASTWRHIHDFHLPYLREVPYDLVITNTTLASFTARITATRMRRHAPIATVVHGYLFDDATSRQTRR